MQALVAAEDSTCQLVFVKRGNKYLRATAPHQQAEVCTRIESVQSEFATTRARAQMLLKELEACRAQRDTALLALAAAQALAQENEAAAAGLRKELDASAAMHGAAQSAAESAVTDSESEVTPSPHASP